MLTQKITINITGKSEGDIELARAEAVRLINDDFIIGGDKNDTGSFYFEVASSDEPEDLNAPRRETCEFVSASSLVPTAWAGWFWEPVSEGASFSWGDNNRSMVTARRFKDHCSLVLAHVDVEPRDVEYFLEKLEALGETYIDLEN